MVDVMDGPEPKKSRRYRWLFSAGKGVGAGVILILALMWLSAGTGFSLLPQNMQRVYVVFKSVGGLKKGEKVRVAGLPKGKVTDLEIKDVVVTVEGQIKLDKAAYEKLLSCVELEEPGPKVLSLLSIRLATPPSSETAKKDLRWAVTVNVQSGPGPTWPEANGSLHLNDDNRVSPEVRELLVNQWNQQEFKSALNIADKKMHGDYETVFFDFSDVHESRNEKDLTVTANVTVQKLEPMVLCTLDIDNDVELGGGERYLITVQQTTPLIGTPFVSMERSPLGLPVSVAKGKEKESERKQHLLNLGKQEAAGLDEIAKDVKKFLPKFEETFSNLGDIVQGLKKFTDNVNQGDGAVTMWMKDPSFRDKMKGAVENFDGVMKKVNDGTGSVGKLVNDPKLHDDLVAAIDRLNSVLKDVDEGKGTAGKFFKSEELYNNANAAAENIKQISAKGNDPTNGGLLSRFVNDRKMGESVQTAFEKAATTMDQIQSSKGLMGALLNDEEMKEKFKVFVSDTKEMMSDAKVVLHEVKEGQSALGKLAVDKRLGKKVEEAIGGAADTFGAISRTRVYLGGQTKYWGTSKEWMAKGYIRIAPRDSMFLQLGGAYVETPSRSPVNADPGNGSESLFRVDAQLGYKFFDNHLTLRAGILEGEPGGGVDYDFTVPGWEHDFRATLEARKGYDNSHINEHLGVVVRGEISTEIWKYIRVYAGAGNSTDGMDWMGGVTFEWTDDDIKQLLGIAGSAANLKR